MLLVRVWNVVRPLLPWIAVAFLGLQYLNLWAAFDMARGDLAHDAARQRLFYRLAKSVCVTRVQFEAAVSEEGWRSERLQAPYNDSLLDDALPTALLVYVEPPIPFGVVDWVAYQFDPAGCLANN